MKYITAVALGLAGVSAQMKEFDSLFRQFGNCMGAEWGSTAMCANIGKAPAQCCKFEVVNESSIDGKFCVTPQ